MTAPWFIAVERFGPEAGEKWRDYVRWSGLVQLDELISLDMMLCPAVLDEVRADWDAFRVQEPNCRHFFSDLAFVRRAAADFPGVRTLCVYRNPPTHPAAPSAFRFVGYDLVEAATAVSALSNCGGWPELDNAELTPNALIASHERARDLQALLPRNHPQEPHAHCDTWAIFTEEESRA